MTGKCDGRRPFRSVLLARRAATAATALCGGSLAFQTAVWAQDEASAAPLAGMLGAAEVISAAFFFGILGAAFLSAIWTIRQKRQAEEENERLRSRNIELSNALQRSESLLSLKDQRLVIWPKDDAVRPELVGSLPAESGVPDERSAFLAFGRWLGARAAAELEQAIIALRDQNVDFETVVATRNGTLLEVQGRRTLYHTIVRFGSVTQSRQDFVGLKAQNNAIQRKLDLFETLAGRAPLPFWQRYRDASLNFVNLAYADAVDADTTHEVVEGDREMLQASDRLRLEKERGEDGYFQGTVSCVVRGDRRRYQIHEVATEEGRCGLGIDVTEAEALSDEIERMKGNHANTLDHLNTAIAIFDDNQTLQFYNQAFQDLFGLDTAFLHSRPDHTVFLDRLRSDGTLAEQPDWRRWKNQLLKAYREVESSEYQWHLPDGRTIRTIANPQPHGGVTWIFDNLTERINLESRYKTAVRIQGETLDNLAEGVVVFGADGRVRLTNPTFATLWDLDPELTVEGTHIGAIAGALEERCQDEDPWPNFIAIVTGFDESREEQFGTIELTDGTILGFSAAPLPNGQVMLTFIDQTDSIRVARALQEKNEALRKADVLKNDFVQNVSYQLRSPLTNIIGFTDLVSSEIGGPLNDTQRDYIDHIASSSASLLTLVNDILDLATVDAGIMSLEIAEVDLRTTLEATMGPLAERLRDPGLSLQVDLENAPDTFYADPERLRQVLFNLISGAADYAPDHSVVTLVCSKTDHGIDISVHTDGLWTDPDDADAIFERFRLDDRRSRDAGLGLSIVKSFVELHGGSVRIELDSHAGTTLHCLFPRQASESRAAE